MGEVLASTILHCVRSWGLLLSNMRGQRYDGASNMSGAVAGCRSLVQKEEPMAVYFHCAAHRLNLAIVSACSIQAFKNTEAYIGEMARLATRPRGSDYSTRLWIPLFLHQMQRN